MGIHSEYAYTLNTSTPSWVSFTSNPLSSEQSFVLTPTTDDFRLAKSLSFTAKIQATYETVSKETEFEITLTRCQVCGNSILEFGETCDDGNKIRGDGCSSIC